MSKRATGFTLLEILIVVIILGALAAAVIPQLSSAGEDARITAMRDSLRTVRSQCNLYRLDHEGRLPGYPAGGGQPDAATFIAQMMEASDAAGVTKSLGTAGFELGPYLLTFPTNPLNGKSTVKVLVDGEADPAAGTDQFGWVFRPATLRFRPDSTGTDGAGVAYFDY